MAMGEKSKMVVCPKCKATIENLKFSAEVETWGTLYVDNDGAEDWDRSEDGDWHDVTLTCPECDAILFTDTGKAKDFLLNTDKLKSMVNKKIKNGK